MENVFENSRARILGLKQDLLKIEFYKRLKDVCPIIRSAGLTVYWVNNNQSGFNFIQTDASEYNNTSTTPFNIYSHLPSQVAIRKFALLIDTVPGYRRSNPDVLVTDTVTSTFLYPLINSKKRTMAVIEFYKMDKTHFSPEHVEYVEELAVWISVYLEQLQTIQKEKIGYDLNEYLHTKLLDFFNGETTFENTLGILSICFKHFLENETSYFYEMSFANITTMSSGFYKEIPRSGEQPLHFELVKPFIRYKENSLLIKVVDYQVYQHFTVNEETYDKIDVNLLKLTPPESIKTIGFNPIVWGCELLGIYVLINPKKSKFPYETELISQYMGKVLYYRNMQNSLDIEKNRSWIIKECLVNIILIPKKYAKDIQHLRNMPENFNELSWVLYNDDDKLLSYIFFMYLQLLPDFFVETTLQKFLTSCMLIHREKPFHNFKLTFLIIRTTYLILIKVGGYLTNLEKCSILFTANMVYCDHNALDNDLMIKFNHPMAKIYKKYNKKESNRVWWGKTIIQSSKVLDHQTTEDRVKIVEIFTHLIKANANWSSMVYFEKIRAALENPEYEFNSEQKKHRKFVMNLIVRCGLQARHVQEFNMVKQLCEDLYKEYFDIGDMEVEMGLQPIARKDRRNYQLIPKFECDYLSDQVVPLFKILYKLFPGTSVFLDVIAKILKAYEIVLSEGKQLWSQDKSVGKSYSELLMK